MQLTVLGCAGSYPSAESPASGYLVHAGDATVVLDLGNGAMSQLLRYCDPADVDAFVISHVHADHCIDLLSVYMHLKYAPAVGQRTRVVVYGPRELPLRLARAYSIEGTNDLRDCFDFRPLPQPGESAQIAGLELTAVRVPHPGESYAIRLDGEGGSLVYSGDTGESEALMRFTSGAHTALFETSFLEPGPTDPPLPADLHMTGHHAGSTARRAGVQQLILTHFVAWNAQDGAHEREEREATAAFGAPVEVAALGRTFHIHSAG
jgi:ribonuclease BN (tRNA processing enzyme)